MRSLFPALWSLVLPSALGGCFLLVAGDGAFIVKGQVPAEAVPAGNCEVRLADAEAKVVFETRKVAGVFAVTFVVSPSKSTYVVQQVCDGVVRQIVRVNYGTDVGPGGSVTFPSSAT